MIFNIGGKGGGGGFAIPTFDGSHAVFGDEKQGYIELYASGTITFSKAMPVDIFLVGGGGSGGISYSNAGGNNNYGGAGGAGGKTLNVFGEIVEGSYTVTVGSGGAIVSSGYGGSAGGATSFGTHTAAGATGADGGSGGGGGGHMGLSGSGTNGGKGGEDGSNGTQGGYSPGAGQQTSTRAFLDHEFPLYSGGGGGGGVTHASTGNVYADGGAGGAGGGGQGGANSNKKALSGTANTGGGGGGSSYAIATNVTHAQSGRSTGGSGIVIARWGYAA